MKPLPNPNLDYQIPLEAVSLVADSEGLRLRAYRCPAGVWTCGWGETKSVTPTTVWTKQDADQRLCDSLNLVSQQVLDCCVQHPTDNQLGALTAFAYNVGMGNFKKSSVLRLHNQANWLGASRAFNLYNKARVRGVLTELAGLTARRASEQALYLKPEPEDQPHSVPQAVETESSLTSSPLVQTGAGLSLTGALSVASDFGDKSSGILGQMRAMSDAVGLQPAYLLGLVAVLGGVGVLYWRAKQRSDGWV